MYTYTHVYVCGRFRGCTENWRPWRLHDIAASVESTLGGSIDLESSLTTGAVGAYGVRLYR